MSETETKVPDVYRAIRDVTKALSKDGITKDKSNEQQHYKFRGIDDIYNALSAVLAGADLCVLPQMKNRTVEERATKSGGVLFYVTVEAEFRLVSARDGSCDIATFFGEAMDSADKATNKAMSAAYKYFALQTFCIPTEGIMEDADSTTPDPAPKTASQPKPQRPPAPKPVPAPPKPPAPLPQQMTMADTVRFTAETWLKKFIAAGHPEEFTKVLRSFEYKEIADIPVSHPLAKQVFDACKEAYQNLPRK